MKTLERFLVLKQVSYYNKNAGERFCRDRAADYIWLHGNIVLIFKIRLRKGVEIEMNRFREWMQHFMEGRYGADQFSRMLTWLVLILLVLSLFVRNGLLELVAVALLVYNYFRIFSRNHAARAAENRKYLDATETIRSKWTSFVNINGQRKDFHIYTCPNKNCRQKIRVPRGKGRIQVTCPKCKTQFIKKS